MYLNSLSSHAAFGLNALSGIIAFGTNGRYAIYAGGQTLINESNSVLDAVGLNEWHHYALVIHGGGAGARKNVEFYRDGKLSVSNTYASNLAVGDSTHVLTIGVDQENNSSYLNGFISNFRWSDEIVYTSEFTVPKFKLKALPSTMLLCCQSSTSVTEAAVSVSGSVTSNGDPAVSAFGPGLKDDITDTGVVFDGVTTFDSQAFMVPPSGKTSERNRGRGVIRGGMTPNSSALTKIAQYIEISSGGNTIDFGDGLDESYGGAGLASATRGVYNLGATSNSSPNSLVNTLEFITIANTANALDFGDLYFAIQHKAPMSNQTRGIFAAGITPASRVMMSYITIATLGNSQDFGDSIGGSYGMNQGGQAGSSTRGLIAGGNSNSAPAEVEKIQFVTFATLGDAQDFGDLVDQNGYFNAGASSGTRALLAGGGNIGSPFTTVNTIQFVTIATTGNATDFGDLTATRYNGGALSNSTRGCFVGGVTYPGATRQNIIDFVNIATTGNAKDFGDIAVVNTNSVGTMSDSHGGLS